VAARLSIRVSTLAATTSLIAAGSIELNVAPVQEGSTSEELAKVVEALGPFDSNYEINLMWTIPASDDVHELFAVAETANDRTAPSGDSGTRLRKANLGTVSVLLWNVFQSESPGIKIGHEVPIPMEFERVKGTGFVEMDERVIPIE